MAMTAINPASVGALNLQQVEKAAEEVSNSDSGFSRVINEFIHDVNIEQLRSDQAVEHLLTGKTESIHDTMIAMSKADLTFRTFMEFRNRAVESYQEIMRMQM